MYIRIYMQTRGGSIILCMYVHMYVCAKSVLALLERRKMLGRSVVVKAKTGWVAEPGKISRKSQHLCETPGVRV